MPELKPAILENLCIIDKGLLSVEKTFCDFKFEMGGKLLHFLYQINGDTLPNLLQECVMMWC